MKIKIILEEVVVPGYPAFFLGKVYEVPEDIGSVLIERGQAVVEKVEEKDDTKAKVSKKNNP